MRQNALSQGLLCRQSMAKLSVTVLAHSRQSGASPAGHTQRSVALARNSADASSQSMNGATQRRGSRPAPQQMTLCYLYSILGACKRDAVPAICIQCMLATVPWAAAVMMCGLIRLCLVILASWLVTHTPIENGMHLRPAATHEMWVMFTRGWTRSMICSH